MNRSFIPVAPDNAFAMKDLKIDPSERPAEYGVVVGRYQLPKLHEGQRTTIARVAAHHPNLVVFLGVAAVQCTEEDPLPVESRRQVILNDFPEANVYYIADVPGDDQKWSRNLDREIAKVVAGPTQKSVLYGSRDSFVKHYVGKHPAVELESDVYASATDVRKTVSEKTKTSVQFMEGVIWALANQFKNPIPTVDAVILADGGANMYLARKEDETGYRFVGGFAENGESWERSLAREVGEETHLEEVGNFRYIASIPVLGDLRYLRSKRKITTTLFACEYGWGTPRPDDDIAELIKVGVDGELVETENAEGKPHGGVFHVRNGAMAGNAVSIVNTHVPLMKAFLAWRAANQKKTEAEHASE